jgi:hypothetical protein
MDVLPFYATFALLCFVLSFGLQTRPAWMWYLGWVMLYLFAGRFGAFAFSAMFLDHGEHHEFFAGLYLLGGLLIWTPAAIWWGTHRHVFGRRRKPGTPAKPPGTP